MNLRDEYLVNLTQDQISRVKSCKNPGEILALAKAEGVELTDEQLEAVNGGACSTDKNKNDGHRKIDNSFQNQDDNNGQENTNTEGKNPIINPF